MYYNSIQPSFINNYTLLVIWVIFLANLLIILMILHWYLSYLNDISLISWRYLTDILLILMRSHWYLSYDCDDTVVPQLSWQKYDYSWRSLFYITKQNEAVSNVHSLCDCSTVLYLVQFCTVLDTYGPSTWLIWVF